MLRVLKQERGVFLWELLAAVSIVATLAVAFASAGTAYFSWHQQDVHLNQEVLMAEQKLDEARQIVEAGGTLTAAQLSGGGGVFHRPAHLFRVDVKIYAEHPDALGKLQSQP